MKIIDADKLAEDLISRGFYPDVVKRAIEDAPAVDAVIPPVEVGQTVWYIRGGYYNARCKKACPITVTEINKKKHGKSPAEWGFVANSTRYLFSSIGKTVFLTEEDAKRALKERKNE